MKSRAITKQLIEQIAEKKNRTKAIASAGITKREFYLYANRFGVEYRRANSPYKLSAHDRELIVSLVKDSDLSYRAIGEKFEVSHTTVKRCVEAHNA